MKNLKKLNRDELKTISGNGLLDNIGGVIGGLGGVVQGVLHDTSVLVGNTLCNVQCVVNGVIQIKLLACGTAC
ncbi:hypothetical protein IQ37_15540 [Chryseobacterium piperi]|uniref:Bacteriocin n=1 Tax=Chryseobacterium piperi TaxID=558152 RepID=A0A086AWP8_9FLAO|nr:hypothetical protein [Chryseobacterium piperi]ASW73473.1 hypothetical protein CJF12_03660 [Chryseobacterium piperi]KFF21112.1 hypothetical protein IQ37_15540 [Chryseobacterium piperi]